MCVCVLCLTVNAYYSLELNPLIDILTTTEVDDAFGCVPHGQKDNVYFVVQNNDNVERRKDGKTSQFWDDRGVLRRKEERWKNVSILG